MIEEQDKETQRLKDIIIRAKSAFNGDENDFETLCEIFKILNEADSGCDSQEISIEYQIQYKNNYGEWEKSSCYNNETDAMEEFKIIKRIAEITKYRLDRETTTEEVIKEIL